MGFIKCSSMGTKLAAAIMARSGVGSNQARGVFQEANVGCKQDAFCDRNGASSKAI